MKVEMRVAHRTAHPFAATPRPLCSWTIPSNIPTSAFGGQSLFGLFTQSIGENLAKFPQGPALDDQFWCV